MTRPRIPRAALAHVPAGATITKVERMAPGFIKYHLDDGQVLHRFTRPAHGDPHDHPFDFVTTVLAGGYVEEVFTFDASGWRSALVHRLPGETYSIPAEHIHRIPDLPAGECWTLVRYGRHRRTTRFWRFGEVVKSRAWNQRRWISKLPAVAAES